MNLPVPSRSPRLYALVYLVTLAIIVGFSIVDPTLSTLEVAVLLSIVLLLGLPHGAAGHVLTLRDAGRKPTWMDKAVCYGRYLGLMGAFGLLWLWSPGVALLLFLALAVYYFGQADLRYLGLSASRHRVAGLSRGLLLIGLPLVTHLDVVAPVVERLTTADPLAWPLLAEHAPLWSTLLIAQHVFIFFALAAPMARWADLLREGMSILMLSVLFVLVNPLIAFAVYFGLWHALGRLLEMQRVFKTPDESVKPAVAYREAGLYVGICLFGLAGLYLAAEVVGLQERAPALLLVLISVLMLPHLLVAPKIWQRHLRPGSGAQPPKRANTGPTYAVH